MPAPPDSTVPVMRRAIAYSVVALDAAGEVDIDRTAEDRSFFAEQKELLQPHLGTLRDIEYGMIDFDLGRGLLAQVRVPLGDAVLDRGVRTGNAVAKAELRGKPGLGASHAFGERIDDMVRLPIRTEPPAVLAATQRLDDLPEFPSKERIRQDLTQRATRQDGYLRDRDQAQAERDRLVASGIRAVLGAAEALARLKGALDQRFPRQRDYVASFFPERKSARSDESPKG